MRILGIDYGGRRVGIAVSDQLGFTAQGVETITYNGIDSLLERLSKLLDQYGVEKIVIGLPKNMNGTDGERVQQTLKFTERLKQITGSEIILWDERLSTVAAHKILNQTNTRGEKRKKTIDTVAAAYILQGYLDSIKT